MKQNKSKIGTVYFTCDRKSLTKTADVLKYGDYNMLIAMYGDNLPYIPADPKSSTEELPHECVVIIIQLLLFIAVSILLFTVAKLESERFILTIDKLSVL